MEHGVEACAGVGTGLIGWQKREFLPHGYVLGAIGAVLAVLLYLEGLLARQGVLQIVG